MDRQQDAVALPDGDPVWQPPLAGALDDPLGDQARGYFREGEDGRGR
jgi:hypothetical protein